MAPYEKMPFIPNNPDRLGGVPVYGSRFVFDTIYDPNSGLSSLNQHQFIEISWLTGGTGVHRIWNEVYPVSRGDLCITNIAVPHAYFSNSTKESDECPPNVSVLIFDLANLFDGDIVEIGGERYLFGLFSSDNFAVRLSLKPKQLEQIEAIFRAVTDELESEHAGWLDAVRSYMTLLLVTCKRLADEKRASRHDKEDDDQLAAQVTRLVSTNFSDPDFSLAEVASRVYKSPSTLSRLFYSATGEFFSEYLRYTRMNHSVELIVRSQLSIDEIAFRCGYRDTPTFYRQFKQTFGISPGKYRLKYADESYKNLNLNNEENQTMSIAILNEISEKLQKGKAKDVAALVTQALEEKIAPEQILNEGLVDGMNVIGDKFRANEVFVPEVLVAARAMNSGLKILKPALTDSGVEPIGKAVICTVKGDMHDIGKNLVKMMIEGKGIECIDLGVDVDPSVIVEAVKQNNAQLVCLSALLTTTMGGQKDVIDALVAAGIRDKVKVMVGGAPVTQEFADEIGADCYTIDSASAANEAKRLILEMKGE